MHAETMHALVVIQKFSKQFLMTVDETMRRVHRPLTRQEKDICGSNGIHYMDIPNKDSQGPGPSHLKNIRTATIVRRTKKSKIHTEEPQAYRAALVNLDG